MNTTNKNFLAEECRFCQTRRQETENKPRAIKEEVVGATIKKETGT